MHPSSWIYLQLCNCLYRSCVVYSIFGFTKPQYTWWTGTYLIWNLLRHYRYPAFQIIYSFTKFCLRILWQWRGVKWAYSRPEISIWEKSMLGELSRNLALWEFAGICCFVGCLIASTLHFKLLLLFPSIANLYIKTQETIISTLICRYITNTC